MKDVTLYNYFIGMQAREHFIKPLLVNTICVRMVALYIYLRFTQHLNFFDIGLVCENVM